MAKPYSQDLRDRVIDPVKGGEVSRRAGAVITRSANWWPSSGWSVLNAGSPKPVGHGGHHASKLMPHRDFLQPRGTRNRTSRFRLCAIAF